MSNYSRALELYQEYLEIRDEAFGLKNGKTNILRSLVQAFKTKNYSSLVCRGEVLMEELNSLNIPHDMNDSSNEEVEDFLEVFSTALGGFNILMGIRLEEVRAQQHSDRSKYFELFRKYTMVHQLAESHYLNYLKETY